MGRKKLTDEEKSARKAEREAKKKSEETAGDFVGKKIEEIKEISSEKLAEAKEKLKKLAEKLAGKIEIADEKDIKGEVKAEEEKTEEERKAKMRKRNEKTLFPLDDYVKYSCHLGTKAVTPKMRQFVYKRRADGIAVLNTNSTDEKLREACEFLKDFDAKDIFLSCKREACWPGVLKFSEVTGIKVFTKKYPAGVITNSILDDFFETELVIVCDPWLDKNALNDARIVKRPVIGLCDTNNLTTGITKVIPCNNKAGKSVGLILYILAREYLKAKGQEKEAKKMKIEDFTGVPDETENLSQAEEIEMGISEEKADESNAEKISEENTKEKDAEEKSVEEKIDEEKVVEEKLVEKVAEGASEGV